MEIVTRIVTLCNAFWEEIIWWKFLLLKSNAILDNFDNLEAGYMESFIPHRQDKAFYQDLVSLAISVEFSFLGYHS